MRYRKLDANGDYSFGQGSADFIVNSPATVAQAILTTLKLFLGEWFLDVTVGVPWYTEIIGFSAKTRDMVIKAAILDVQGVSSIVSYASQVDAVKRTFSVQCTVDTIYSSADGTSTASVSV
jgi:hypothetical protein